MPSHSTAPAGLTLLDPIVAGGEKFAAAVSTAEYTVCSSGSSAKRHVVSTGADDAQGRLNQPFKRGMQRTACRSEVPLYVTYLRKKLEAERDSPMLIKTEVGIG